MSAQSVAKTDNFRALWPVGLYDPKTVEIVEREWSRVQDDGREKRPGRKRGAPGAEAKAANKTAQSETGKAAQGKVKTKSGAARNGKGKH